MEMPHNKPTAPPISTAAFHIPASSLSPCASSSTQVVVCVQRKNSPNNGRKRNTLKYQPVPIPDPFFPPGTAGLPRENCLPGVEG